MQRVVVNYKPEAAIDADLFVRYDYEAASSARPAAYPLDSEDVVAIYGTSVYGVPTYGGASQPLVVIALFDDPSPVQRVVLK